MLLLVGCKSSKPKEKNFPVIDPRSVVLPTPPATVRDDHRESIDNVWKLLYLKWEYDPNEPFRDFISFNVYSSTNATIKLDEYLFFTNVVNTQFQFIAIDPMRFFGVKATNTLNRLESDWGATRKINETE